MNIPYNKTRLQRERIIERLRRGPVARPVLEHDQNIPDATARIHELRQPRYGGFKIRTEIVTIFNSDGSSSKAALNDGNDPQKELFPERSCAAS